MEERTKMGLLRGRDGLEKAMKHPDITDDAYAKCLAAVDLINSALVGDEERFAAMQQALEILRPLLRPGHPAQAN